MSVNEDKNIGDAVVDRKTEQGLAWTIGSVNFADAKYFVKDRYCNVIAQCIHTVETARAIAAAPALYAALKESALAVHTIGAYHHPSWITFEQCDKPPCVKARGVLALVNDHPDRDP